MKALLDLESHWKLHTLNTEDPNIREIFYLFPDYEFVNVVTSGNYLVDVFLEGYSVGYFFVKTICNMLGLKAPPIERVTDEEVSKSAYTIPLFGDFE